MSKNLGVKIISLLLKVYKEPSAPIAEAFACNVPFKIRFLTETQSLGIVTNCIVLPNLKNTRNRILDCYSKKVQKAAYLKIQTDRDSDNSRKI